MTRLLGPRPALRRWVAAGVLLLGVAACGGAAPSDAPAETAATPPPPPSAAATDGFLTLPTADGAIQPGRYRVPASAWSVSDFTLTVPAGWTIQYGQVFAKHADTGAELGFYPVVVDRIYADACLGSTGGELSTGRWADDLTYALSRQEGPRLDIMPTTLGGYEGLRVDLTVKEGFDLGDCNMEDVGLQVWYSEPADKYFVLLEDAEASAYVLDVGQRRQVFLAQVGSEASEDDRAELQAVLTSIRIEAPAGS